MSGRRDEERVRRIVAELKAARLDAVVCALPENVLLLSGYWPVIGRSLAMATRDGQIAVIVPEDERELAEAGMAGELRTFRPVSLEALVGIAEAIKGPAGDLARRLGLRGAAIGCDAGPASEPPTYSGLILYGSPLEALLRDALSPSRLVSAGPLLERLRSVKTPAELDRIRTACRIAGRAFRAGAQQLRPGLLETEAAIHFRAPLSTAGTGFEGVQRADGFTWCMSGPNAALAQAAYARSRPRPIRPGELALVHCNSYADGYWTDITRTYCVGPADGRVRSLYECVLEARATAIDAIRPGARAAEVDRAARGVLEARGLGTRFPHPSGHGVGFVAIDPYALPRIHPRSPDHLETGMVFNLEPAVYIEGECGLRHCDMVAVTDRGTEVLTTFHDSLDPLTLA